MCFRLEICFNYTTQASHLNTLIVDIVVSLDIALQQAGLPPRAFFPNQPKDTQSVLVIRGFEMKRGRIVCQPLEMVYLNVGDTTTFQVSSGSNLAIVDLLMYLS